MKKIYSILFVSILTSATTVSAAPYPDLYPNQHLKSVGPERARHDVVDCQIAADDYLAQKGTESTGRKAVKGAARGAALGALGGAIMGNTGRGAGAGAAIGGVKSVAGSAKEKSEGSPEYRQYVEACLDDRGYKVVGWKAKG